MSKIKYDIFASWHYGKFPYVLGAKAVLQDNGFVKAKGYERYQFKPCYLGSIEEGEKLKEKLLTLETERSNTLEIINKGFDARLKTISQWKNKDKI